MCSIEFNATTFLHNQIPVDHAPSALGFLATTESDAEDEDEISNNKNAFGCNSSKPINQLLTAVLPDFFAHVENCNPANCLPSHQTKFPQIAYSGYSAALRI